MEGVKILGIDPGSRFTGYAIISACGNSLNAIAYGYIETQGQDFSQKLYGLYAKIDALITHHRPTEVSIEKIFFHKNAQSALKLGQSRAAGLIAAAKNILSVHEYSAREIKQAITGYGSAAKAQMQHAVKIVFSLASPPPEDAADALAIAACHAFSRNYHNRIAAYL